MVIRSAKPPFASRLQWLAGAMIHFGLSQLIIPVTMVLTKRSAGTPEGAGMPINLLVHLTQLLHFPLITLALYPREWFPGNWIYLPMAANSLIWAWGICWLSRLVRKSLWRP